MVRERRFVIRLQQEPRYFTDKAPTTEIYLTPTRDEVIEGVLAHHARQSRVQEAPPPQPAPGYDPQSLSVLFGRPS